MSDTLGPDNSTASERAAARRQMIGDEVERTRRDRGDKAAADLERRLFEKWERALADDQD